MLQGDGVTMIALGVSADTPPNTIQPRLPDGVHLRAVFERDLGFPWFGFYLFRRKTVAPTMVCLSTLIGAQKTGSTGTASLETSLARVSSDANLVFTDDFPATGAIELDLDSRKRLRVDLKETARQVTATIGF